MDDAHVSWPASVSVGGTPVLRVDVRAGYDEGMYAACEVAALEGAESLPELVDEAMLAAALEEAAGSEGVASRGTRWRPPAPLLDEYFDRLDCANQEVEVVYPNGRVAARGVLAGWTCGVAPPCGASLAASSTSRPSRRASGRPAGSGLAALAARACWAGRWS